MGGVFSSSSTEETHNIIDSSSNSTIPTDSQNPGSLNSNMSDPDSKTLDQEKPLEDSKQQSAKQEQEKPLEDSKQQSAKQEQEKPLEDSKRSEKEASENAEEEEEEEGECGFCLFMKGGGCKESFVAWEKCIEEAEKNKEDIVDKCADITGALKKCMEAHPDYYEPILRAEKVAEDEAIKELEKEKEKEKEQEQEQEQKIASN